MYRANLARDCLKNSWRDVVGTFYMQGDNCRQHIHLSIDRGDINVLSLLSFKEQLGHAWLVSISQVTASECL